jgi:anaerobic ribonucleoside-triphosphate reductase activating protein
MTKHLLNIAEYQPKTATLGPGLRFAIWVQGCPFTCKGCVSPKWVPFQLAQAIPVAEMADRVVQTQGIEGITLSGGEPMMQAGRLANLLEIVLEKRPELNVIVFSGFQLGQLVWADAKRLLSLTDVLIDGQYIANLNDSQGLRGSSNQCTHFLTDTLRHREDYFFKKQRNVEFHVKDDGVLMVGVPTKDFHW